MPTSSERKPPVRSRRISAAKLNIYPHGLVLNGDCPFAGEGACVSRITWCAAGGSDFDNNDSKGIERLRCYRTRPAISNKWLSVNCEDNVKFKVKDPWHKGATHVAKTPMESVRWWAVRCRYRRLMHRIWFRSADRSAVMRWDSGRFCFGLIMRCTDWLKI